MKIFVIAMMALFAATPAFAEKPATVTGFTCTASNGTIRRFNIDVKKKTYQLEGENTRQLGGWNEAVIDIVADNVDLLNTPMGPVFYSEKLDRRTLVLTISRQIPDRNIHETAIYQCVMGPAIDFAAGRKF